jgi:phosphopantothenoylcysteine decarboxylase/phosphopantothenate--cysteine ligase
LTRSLLARSCQSFASRTTRKPPTTSPSRRVGLIVTGGVAAFRALELVSLLRDRGLEVEVVLTAAAREFVAPRSFAALIGRPVFEELFGTSVSPHTELARSLDLLVVAPATADFLAKVAHGMADDLAGALWLAHRGPKIVAPAMHEEMWLAPATKRSIALLVGDGVRVIGPVAGRLAGGDTGLGRLIEPQVIAEAVSYWLRPDAITMDGERVLVTAGGTREPIDAVRYVGNRSSGKQGNALAVVAAVAGARVWLVTAAAPPPPHPLLEVIEVETASEMAEAVRARSADADWVVMSAAVADFTPEACQPGKLKRSGRDWLDLHLVPTPDILGEVVASRRPGQVVVGFAAEVGDLEGKVKAKLASKGVDLVVGNDVSLPGHGFGTETNGVLIADRRGGLRQVLLARKEEIAAEVLRAAWALRHEDRVPPTVEAALD